MAETHGAGDASPRSPLAQRPQNALLIVNRSAGPGLWFDVDSAVGVLRAAGWRVAVAETAYRGHASELARQGNAEGYGVVIACGGDGTVNEVLQGVVGTPAALGILPMGTANVLAREIGLPLGASAAAATLASGHIRAVDVGQAGERYFVMMAGIGLDAEVVREVEHARSRLMRLVKAPVLAVTATRRLLTDRGKPMTIIVDDEVRRARAVMVVVSNIRSYAGLFEITSEADWTDGILDVMIFHGGGLGVTVRNVAGILLRRQHRVPTLEYLRARHVWIGTPRPVPVQADGDVVAETPLAFRVMPKALRIILPGPHS